MDRVVNALNRRGFLKTATGAAWFGTTVFAADDSARKERERRISGLLYGTAFGDAFGGPIEFQDPDQVQKLPTPPRRWREGYVLDRQERTALADRIRLRAYDPLRPVPESYGQWNPHAAPGTITDDTRHKLILLYALHQADRRNRWPVGAREMAQAFLDWPAEKAVSGNPGYGPLAADWLEEWQLAARWILGERDARRARPPERMWQGLPTCCGQMTSLPLAALFPGRPEEAYLAAWRIGFFDNGWGRDLNAATVAGLSVALTLTPDPSAPREAWNRILAAMRQCDPFGYSKIRWTQRAVDRWLDYALRTARESGGQPARMFAAWDTEFRDHAKWEAQIPFVVMIGCLSLCEFDPLASLQLSQEWGWDTDSYAQLLGAFVGALYGPAIFRREWLEAVESGLNRDFGFALRSEAEFLAGLAEDSHPRRQLIGE
ncbi:MAG: ADP-ribosylglycohydrolase family protein [Verrucomicrobiales bacterium]|nr:ADP-ribosylglycohydrolase family protein [Verrucomicrobiales bacterium]